MKSEVSRVAIVGQGYVGLPLAMAACSVGHQVLGIELGSDRVAALNSGASHIEDVADDDLQRFISNGLYRATSISADIADCDVVVICVPTPLNEDREPDLTLLKAALYQVAPFLKPHVLLVSESTSYPGTARQLVVSVLREVLGDASNEILVASAPERVDPGNPNFNHLNTPRLVAGLTPDATRRALNFYRSFTEQVIEVSSPEIAETAKLLENTFRQVNIALANEVAMICKKLGISVREVIDAAATKPYGFMKFSPGAGVGGHCIPVDPSYLSWRAKSVGAPTRFIDLANEVNLEMPVYVSERLLEILVDPTLKGEILLLGVAYKPGVGDTRETPAQGVAEAVEAQGRIVRWNDPFVLNWRGDTPSSLDGDFQGVVVVTAQPGVDVSDLVLRGIPVLDCTGTHLNIPGVHQL